MAVPTSSPLNILLVEDNAGDVYLVRQAIEESGLFSGYQLTVAADGVEAMDRLRGWDGVPDLVILDLNLPCKNGREVLAELSADERWRRLPVAILSTSHYESGIGLEFRQLRTTFAAKTARFVELIGIVQRFYAFARGGAG